MPKLDLQLYRRKRLVIETKASRFKMSIVASLDLAGRATWILVCAGIYVTCVPSKDGTASLFIPAAERETALRILANPPVCHGSQPGDFFTVTFETDSD